MKNANLFLAHKLGVRNFVSLVIKRPVSISVFLFIGTLLFGCAQSKSWNGGNACDQIGKNQTELQKLESQIQELRANQTAADSPTLQSQITSLEEQKRDLEISSAKLFDDCQPIRAKKPLDREVYPK